MFTEKRRGYVPHFIVFYVLKEIYYNITFDFIAVLVFIIYFVYADCDIFLPYNIDLYLSIIKNMICFSTRLRCIIDRALRQPQT